MEDALAVSGGHGEGQLLDQRRRLSEGQRLLLEAVGQRAAGAELHREERQAAMLADLVDLDDVRVLQAGPPPPPRAGAGDGPRPGAAARPVRSLGARPPGPQLPGAWAP